MKKILTALLAGLVAAGSFATVSSAALAMLEELPTQGEWAAEAAYEDGTIVWFSNGGFNDAETAKSLFDQDLSTKWCHQEQWSFVTWEVAEPVSITGYQLVTANDNEQYPGRIPLTWYLKGCNDYDVNTDEGSWEVIDTVSDSVAEGLQDLNWATFTFTDFDVEEVPAYKFYCFEVEALGSANLMQLSEFSLVYEGKAEQVVDAEAAKAEADAAAALAAIEANKTTLNNMLAKTADYQTYIDTAATFTYPSSGTTVPEGSVLINGTRIGDAFGWGESAGGACWAAFDGNPDSYFDPTNTGISWTGIDAGEEMILSKVIVRSRDGWLARFNGATIEASNDPNFENKVELFVSAADAPELTYMDLTDQLNAANNTGYRYFRYINYNNTGDVSEIELYGYAKDGSNPEYSTFTLTVDDITAQLNSALDALLNPVETEATETEAPETEAPETEAPETEAPETEAPETEAPETEATETEEVVDVAEPDTTKEETEAPKTFDAAIIAGIAAVVSLAGYAVSKKH